MGLSLFDQNISNLEASMNIRSRIQDAISSNIANVNTPGYKCKNINFQEEFEKVVQQKKPMDMDATNEKHFKIHYEKNDGYQVEQKDCDNYILGNDKNNVDMDKEMSEMSKNNLYFTVESQILVKNMKILKDVIMQGGK